VTKTWNEEAAIRGAMRRVFSRSPVIREVLFKVRREVPRFNKDGSRAKRDAVQYLCNICGEYAGSTQVAVDHIEPVISIIDGFVNWDTFKDRLFCDASNLQVVCDSCHNEKTQKERIRRLLLQYGKELDTLELQIKTNILSKSEVLKMLKKYLAKKKTSDLKSVVQRAQKIKEEFEKTCNYNNL
jgi:5-methylcytosine-specific restriction endonuclease McrA